MLILFKNGINAEKEQSAFRLAGSICRCEKHPPYLVRRIRMNKPILAVIGAFTGIAALFVLAFLFIEWVPMVRRDNSMDVDKVLEQSEEKVKEKSKELDSELERIRSELNSELERLRSETDEIASTPNLEAKAQQPNTIYATTVDDGLTLAYLISVEAKEEPKPDSQENYVVVCLPEKIRASKSNEEELPDYFAYWCRSMLLDGELKLFSGDTTTFSGTLAKWRKRLPTSTTTLYPSTTDKLAVLAVKVKLLTSHKPIDENSAFQDPEDVDAFLNSHSTPEIKAFVATLRDGESGEFDGWHYLKVDGAFSEESEVDE